MASDALALPEGLKFPPIQICFLVARAPPECAQTKRRDWHDGMARLMAMSNEIFLILQY